MELGQKSKVKQIYDFRYKMKSKKSGSKDKQSKSENKPLSYSQNNSLMAKISLGKSNANNVIDQDQNIYQNEQNQLDNRKVKNKKGHKKKKTQGEILANATQSKDQTNVLLNLLNKSDYGLTDLSLHKDYMHFKDHQKKYLSQFPDKEDGFLQYKRQQFGQKAVDDYVSLKYSPQNILQDVVRRQKFVEIQQKNLKKNQFLDFDCQDTRELHQFIQPKQGTISSWVFLCEKEKRNAKTYLLKEMASRIQLQTPQKVQYRQAESRGFIDSHNNYYKLPFKMWPQYAQTTCNSPGIQPSQLQPLYNMDSIDNSLLEETFFKPENNASFLQSSSIIQFPSISQAKKKKGIKKGFSQTESQFKSIFQNSDQSSNPINFSNKEILNLNATKLRKLSVIDLNSRRSKIISDLNENFETQEIQNKVVSAKQSKLNSIIDSSQDALLRRKALLVPNIIGTNFTQENQKTNDYLKQVAKINKIITKCEKDQNHTQNLYKQFDRYNEVLPDKEKQPKSTKVLDFLVVEAKEEFQRSKLPQYLIRKPIVTKITRAMEKMEMYQKTKTITKWNRQKSLQVKLM